MSSLKFSIPCTLAIGLGANLPSPAGPPELTLIKTRPLLEKLIYEWAESLPQMKTDDEIPPKKLTWLWSPLYETEPLGGAPDQPIFINAVLLVEGHQLMAENSSESAALDLLNRVLLLEKKFGRERVEGTQWEPRSLDIDILFWGSLQMKNDKLILPHPRIIERNFVITPLAAALSQKSSHISQISPQPGWKE